MAELKQCKYCGNSNQTELPACPKCMMALAMRTDAGANQSDQEGHLLPVEDLVAAFPGFEIQHLVGHGGMGAVYQARQLNLDRVVALKILSPRLSSDPAFAERFLREARTLARLSHPNIVTVFDFGQTGEFYFLTMEFVDGVNLRDTISAGLIDSKQALAIVPQICDALQYAHDSGVVHRDIKPENILIAKNGSIKIADFGLAKILEPTPEQYTLTGTRQVLGTRNYMAPEQIESPEVVDHRADLYSLGVVFYELLTGELPLGRFALPSEKSATVTGQLDDVVMRTLEKDPGRRFQQASQIKSACESLHQHAANNEIPYVDEANARSTSSRDSYENETLSSVPISQPFPVTIEDVYASLASGYGMLKGFETHLELEYEIRDAVMDHKWDSKKFRLPLDRIVWINLHKGTFYTYIDIQADQIEAVSALPNSKQGKFRLYLKKANRANADQLVGYVQNKLAHKVSPNAPLPPIKSGLNSPGRIPMYHAESSPLAIAFVFGFVTLAVLFVGILLMWVFSGHKSKRALSVIQAQAQAVDVIPDTSSVDDIDNDRQPIFVGTASVGTTISKDSPLYEELETGDLVDFIGIPAMNSEQFKLGNWPTILLTEGKVQSIRKDGDQEKQVVVAIAKSQARKLKELQFGYAIECCIHDPSRESLIRNDGFVDAPIPSMAGLDLERSYLEISLATKEKMRGTTVSESAFEVSDSVRYGRILKLPSFDKNDPAAPRPAIADNKTKLWMGPTLITNRDVIKAKPFENETSWGVLVELTNLGAQKVAYISEKYNGEFLAVSIAGETVYCPKIEGKLGKHLLLHTGSTKADAEEIARSIVEEKGITNQIDQ